MRKYGISTISLWPLSLGLGGFDRSIKIAKKAGFDGIQTLPMKWWPYKKARRGHKDVISFENAWNYGPLWKALLRKFGFLDEAPGTPRLGEWALFGNKEMSVPNAMFCTHRINEVRSHPNWVLEISADFSPEKSVYIDFATGLGRLCWDTLHVRRPAGQHGDDLSKVNEESILVADGDWYNLLDELPGESIRLIHVRPAKGELESLLDGKSSTLTDMLALLAAVAPRNTPAILELFPVFVKGKGISYLNDVLEAVKDILG